MKASWIHSAAKALLRPLRDQLAFFMLTYAMWTPQDLSIIVRTIIYRLPVNGYYLSLVCCMLMALLFTYIATTIVHLSRSRIVKWAMYGITILNYALYIFLKLNVNSCMTPDVLRAIVETSPGEATNFVHTYLTTARGLAAVVAVPLLVVVVVIIDRWWCRCVRKPRAGRKTTVAVGLVTALTLAAGAYCTTPLVAMLSSDSVDEVESNPIYGNDMWGFDNASTYLYSAHVLKINQRELTRAIDATLASLQSQPATSALHTDSLDVVLVIGESYIKRHAAVYGYPLNTTPAMCAERDHGNLVAFTDAISGYNYTSPSMKSMLFCNSQHRGEHWYESPIVFAPFRKAGFEVYMWDNQKTYFSNALFTFALNSMLYDPKMVEACYTAMNMLTFDYDEDLVVDYITGTWFKERSTRTLTVFHLMGQHFDCAKRYPEQLAYFTADSIQRSEPYIDQAHRERIAQYDNATRYNDRVLGTIFDAYRDRNAVVVYLADHGEEMYDYRDFAGRDEGADKAPMTIKYQNEVPMMVWCSDKYLSNNPTAKASLTQAAGKPFILDDLAQLLLGLAKINTPLYRPELDLLSPGYKPHKRIVYDRQDYDALK